MRKFQYVITTMALLLLCNLYASAQGVIKGVIKSESGEPLANASVIVGGNKGGTSTDTTGLYRLSLAPGTYKLFITSVGFNPFAITVKVENGEVTRSGGIGRQPRRPAYFHYHTLAG